jgi:FkbM family methyltransferase
MIRFIRNNAIINTVGRSVILALLKIAPWAKSLANKYRVYGRVSLNIEGVHFSMYAEADDFIVNELYYGLSHEALEFRLVKELVTAANHFIDVGANTGAFSAFASHVNPSLQIVAMEPHPVNFKRLLLNAAQNGKNIRCFQLAAGSNESTIQLTIPADESLSTTASANNLFTKNIIHGNSKLINVQQTTLDNLLKPYTISSADLIKIDVEYYEPEVLKGALWHLGNVRPLILMEVLYHSRLVSQFPSLKGQVHADHVDQIQQIMRMVGYHAYALEPDGVRFSPDLRLPATSNNYLFSPLHVTDCVPYDQVKSTFSTPQ